MVIRESTVSTNATAPEQTVRCVIPSFAAHLDTDELQWMPYVTGAGVFYPKAGDRALVAEPEGGPPAIVAWWPKAAVPDVEL
jgi:hypothetical protein